MKEYKWHGKPCKILVEPIYKAGVKRNALIEFENGTKTIVPRRALRLIK